MSITFRAMSTSVYHDQWLTLNNLLPTDRFNSVALQNLTPKHTVQSAQERKIVLLPALEQSIKMPAIHDYSEQDIRNELAELDRITQYKC
jgi:hypothetical protein